MVSQSKLIHYSSSREDVDFKDFFEAENYFLERIQVTYPLNNLDYDK